MILTAGAAVATAVTAAVYANSTPITVADAPSAGSVGTATAYPSIINVAGETTVVSDVNVALTGFAHGFSDDFDVLLQSPSGLAVLLMSDAGDGNAVTGLNISLDDGAAATLPDETPPSSGFYRPTNYGKSAAPFCKDEPDPDTFPSPAPEPPVTGYPTTLSTFSGTPANGDWKLYVVDDCRGDVAFVASGWSLGLNGPTAVGVRSLTGRSLGRSVELRWRTASERAIAGFNVFRSNGRVTKRLNMRLIAAKQTGSSRGAAYRFVDRRLRPGTSYTYRLQVVRIDGTRQSAGIVALRAR